MSTHAPAGGCEPATPAGASGPEGTSAWAQHLAGTPAPEGTLAAGLTLAEARRVQRYRDQLLAAVQARDRAALRSTQGLVLRAAFGPRGKAASPALGRALRELSWCMAGWLLPRGRRH